MCSYSYTNICQQLFHTICLSSAIWLPLSKTDQWYQVLLAEPKLHKQVYITSCNCKWVSQYAIILCTCYIYIYRANRILTLWFWACKNVPFHSKSYLMNKLCMVCAIGEILRKSCYGCTFCIDFLTIYKAAIFYECIILRACNKGGGHCKNRLSMPVCMTI